MSESNTPDFWELPKSHDIGVAYYHHNLLKGNPIVERYFRQWLARIDKSNIEKFYDYESDEIIASIRGQHPCEINYDQIQRMVRNANLDLEIENQIFYHLDYMDNKGTIDFRRVKEYFAYAGIEGVYNLEDRKHFQISYDPPFAVDHLEMGRWNDEDREDMARMMAAPGEVPQHQPEIEKIEETISTMLFESMSTSGLLGKLETEGKNIRFDANDTLEQMEDKSRRHEEETEGFRLYQDEIASLTEQFYKRQDVLDLQAEVRTLQSDEQDRLAAAIKAYVPLEDAHISELNPSLSLEQDRAFEQMIDDTDRWATAFFDGKKPEDFPNHEPDDAEKETLDPVLVERGDYHFARYKVARQQFDETYRREIRVRNAAFKDWAFKDFILSPINRGELAKIRKADMPRDFANAVKAELSDGLMEKIKAPVRIERIHDGSGRYNLIVNDRLVGDFHPQEVLHMATEKDQAPQEILDERKRKNPEADDNAARDEAALFDGLDEDDGAYIPGEPSPDQRQAEKTKAQVNAQAPAPDDLRSHTPTPERPSGKGPASPKADAGKPGFTPRTDAPGAGGFPGMGAMPGMTGMGGMGGMGGMRPGMGMPPPMFSFNMGLPKLGGLKSPSMPGNPFGARFDADAMASSISLKTQAVGSLSEMLKTGKSADGQALTADQTLGAWGDMANTIKSLSDDVAKTLKAGDRKLTPSLGEAIKDAKQTLESAKPFVDDKAVEPGAVGEAARKAKQEMEKLAKMLIELVKSILKLFGRRREPEPSPEP